MNSTVKIGTKLSDDMIPLMLEEWQCKQCRVVLEGSFISSEYEEDRLNIFININKQIQKINVG